MSEEITLKIKKENLWKYSTFILLAVVIIGIIVMVAGDGKSNTPDDGVVTGTQQTGNTLQVDFEQVIDADTPVEGSADAPITIIEFADFSCPWCVAASGYNVQYTTLAKQQIGSSWEPPVSNIREEYVASGQVRIATLFTPGHSGGHSAQTVAWCLNDQDSELYWAFYEKAFEAIDDVEDAAKMRALAQTVSGANMKELDACIASDKYESRFAEEQAKASALGISGTPGFIIGKSDGSAPSTVIRGADSYATFKQIIEANL